MGLPVVIPTRTSLNANAAADVNGLMSNCTDLDSRVVNVDGRVETAETKLDDVPDGVFYACRAWVNFNGTGTVAIRASGNVSSITDNGTGAHTVNFTSAMEDANYCVSQSRQDGNPAGGDGVHHCIRSEESGVALTVDHVMIFGWNWAGSAYDSPTICVAIFR